MAKAEKFNACKQAPKCGVSKDGKCLEGLPLTECPHFFLADVAQSGAEEKPVLPTERQINLSSGEEWNISNLGGVMNQYSTKKIFIIGDSDSGKTTLLVRLFSCFQHGPFKEFFFAGSTTLMGFERRIHLSKIESNGDDEKTEKTKSKEFSFLHLALKKRARLTDPATHFLLSDISGERIQLARDNSTEMKELNLLKGADFILIFIDGAKIANKKLRLATLLKSQTFLRQALDDGVISTKSKVRVILSKWDLLAKLSGFDFDQEIINPFDQIFKDRLLDLYYYKICTRSSQPSVVDSFYGIEDLLIDWTTTERYQLDRSKFSDFLRSTRSISNYFVI